MAIIIGTDEYGYVTYLNEPEQEQTLAKNESTANDALDAANDALDAANGALDAANDALDAANDALDEIEAGKITSVIQEYTDVAISSNLSVNLSLPETVPPNGFLYAATEDWNRPASGAAAFIVHSRKSGVTIFSTSAVTFPKIVLRLYYVDYDVKGGV